ncbi:hypothetical protein RIF24_13580 [Exiguobacterium acetylicum]|uniref:hypothetical protein n=1 Tax=Exiguobacterium acetylicum TaxID=41170 RepID=UPI00397784EF
MYKQEIFISKVDDIFEELRKQSSEIITIHSDPSTASEMIVEAVSSETIIRSKTLMIDMYAYLSERTLSSSLFSDTERKSLFFEANIRGQILLNYRFESTSIKAFQMGIKYKNINRLYASLAVAAGTTAVGGILKYMLINTVNIPIVIIIAGAVSVFFASFFKITPDLNKTAFHKAVDDFLSETRNEFILWFDEIEIFYNKCIESLIKTF